MSTTIKCGPIAMHDRYPTRSYVNRSLSDSVEDYCRDMALVPEYDTIANHHYGRTLVAHDYKGRTVPIRVFYI